MKVGAAGFSLGVTGLVWLEDGRVPITPTGGGEDWWVMLPGGRNSSSSEAMPVANAEEEPWVSEGRRDGARDHGWLLTMDQLVARGELRLIAPMSAAGQPKFALSVEGRGRSHEAMEAGRGLLGSRSGCSG